MPERCPVISLITYGFISKKTVRIISGESMEESKEFNIDEALNRLTEINRRLAEEGVTLSESLALYKEGVELAEKCRENLDSIEKEIIILTPED